MSEKKIQIDIREVPVDSGGCLVVIAALGLVVSAAGTLLAFV